MKFKAKSIIALLMVVCLVLSISPAVVSAEENSKEHPSSSSINDIIAGVVSPETLFGTIEETTVPEIIGYENAVSKMHTQRLYNKEGDNLYKLVFLNADGSTTEYLYDYPVKYPDKNTGMIKDITLEIAESDIKGQFESKANKSSAVFSKEVSDGIILSGEDISITLIPRLFDNQANVQNTPSIYARQIDTKTISYDYDEKTSLEYSLTYTGFKEDIVVKEYTGQTEYNFTLLTNGLHLSETNGSYSLLDSKENVKAVIGDIIIFTNDNINNTVGKIISKTIVENQEYLLTIVVDAEFLLSSETAYPIRIDPTIEICYGNNGAGAISDVTINSNSGSSPTSNSLFVGLRQTYGISRILMKFPGLDLSSLGNNIVVTNAAVELRDLLCESEELDVYCYVFTGNVWDESTVEWSNVSPNSYASILSSHAVSYSNGTQQPVAHWYSFDITTAVEGWRTGNYNPNEGIIFKASYSVENGNTYISKTFSSYNRTSYRPSLSVTYNTTSNLIDNDTYYLNNRYCGDYLRFTPSSPTATSGLISSLGDSIRWEIVSVAGGYVIRSKSDITNYLAVPISTSSDSVSIVTVNDSSIPTRCKWTITWATGGGCLVKNNYNSRYLYSYGDSLYTASSTGTSGTSTYDSVVWRIASTSYYGNTVANIKRELSAATYINNIEGPKLASIYINVDSYYDELWDSPSDFTYSFSEYGIANYSSSKMKLLKYGGTKVEAVHKVTDRVKSFYIIVGFSTTISSTPLEQYIIDGLNQPYDVWPASSESRYYSYSTMDRAEALTDIYEMALLTMIAGWVAQNPDAASMLNHFLDNNGTLYDVGMKEMISEWDTASGYRERDMNYVMKAVEASASYSYKTFRTISLLGCTVSEGTNWGRAVGSYSTSIVCTYRKTSATSFTMQITYELHDVYDWDRTITSMGNLPVSPSDMWELHHGGLAKNYEVYGKNTFTLSWSTGQTFGQGAVMSNET